MGARWTPRDPAAVRQAYERGETMQVIGEREDVSRLTVRRFLAEQGVRIRARGEERRAPAGATRRTGRGHLLVKTAGGEWKTRQHVTWTRVHGSVPDGCAVMRLRTDLGDDEIDAVDNLVLASLETRRLLTTSTAHGLRLDRLPQDREIRLLAGAAAAILVGDGRFRAGRPARTA